MECTRAAAGFQTLCPTPQLRDERVIETPINRPGHEDRSARPLGRRWFRRPAAEGGARWPRAAVWSVAICLGWGALAARSPDVTYHLAPFAAASAWPVAARLAHREPLRFRAAIAIVAGSLALTLATALVLAADGRLGGPSVWHGSGALETVLASIGGAAWGWRVATRARPGLVGRLG